MTDLEYEEAKIFTKVKLVPENEHRFIKITLQCYAGKILIYTRVPKGQEQKYVNFVYNTYLTYEPKAKHNMGRVFDAYWREISAEEYERV